MFRRSQATVSDVVNQCRDLLAQQKALEAERVAYRHLAMFPNSAALIGVGFRAAEQLYRFDVAFSRLRLLVRLANYDAFHSTLFLQFAQKIGFALDDTIIDELEAAGAEPGLVARSRASRAELNALEQEYPRLFLKQTPTQDVLDTLSSLLGKGSQCETALLNVLPIRRDAPLLDFAYHFFSRVRISEVLWTYVRWLRVSSDPANAAFAKEYHQALLARGNLQDVLELELMGQSSTVLLATVMSSLHMDSEECSLLARRAEFKNDKEKVFIQARNAALQFLSAEAGAPLPEVSIGNAPAALNWNRVWTEQLRSVKRPLKLNSKPRVALCISGQLRGHKNAFSSMRKQIVEPLNADVFVHTWSKTGTGRTEGKKLHRFIPYSILASLPDRYQTFEFVRSAFPTMFEAGEVSESVTQESLREVYRQKSGVIDEENDFEERAKALFGSSVSINQLKMYYSMFCANKLAAEYAAANGFDYDIVIRARPDNIVENFKIDIDEIRATENRTRVFGAFFIVGGISDQFAVGQAPAMQTYCGGWKCLEECRTPIPLDGFSGRLAEYFMLDNLFVSGAKFSILPPPFKLSLGGDYLDLATIASDLSEDSMTDARKAFMRQHAEVLKPFVSAVSKYLAETQGQENLSFPTFG